MLIDVDCGLSLWWVEMIWLEVGSGVEVVYNWVHSAWTKALQRVVAHCNWGANDAKIRSILRPRVVCAPDLPTSRLHHAAPPQCAGTCAPRTTSPPWPETGRWTAKAGHQSPKLPHLEFDYQIWPPIFLVEATYILYLIICVRPYAYGGVRPCALTQLSAETWPSKDIVECQKMATFVFVSKLVPYFSRIYIYKNI